MSQVNTNSIYDASGGSNAVLYGVAAPANSMGFRNRIINGGMVIDQRNAGASLTTTTVHPYTLDRWQAFCSVSSKFTVQQTPSATETGYATRVAAGFTNYLGCTSSAATSVGSGDYYLIRQSVEGLNCSDLAWGTASAKPVTLSFWVYSSLTGTFGGALGNSANNRTYPFTYTISAANTWEQKTVTVAGDTTGTWLTTNGIGIKLTFSLGMGSTYSGTAGSWASAEYYSATGATSVVGTNGATFYITGVQLEAGSVASPFERRDYGRELMMCQRYYWASFSGQTPSGWPANFLTTSGYQGTALTTGMINQGFFLPVPMRAAPTGSVWDYLATAGKTSSFNPNVANYGNESGSVTATSATMFTLQRVSGNNASQVGAYVALSAEL